MALLAHFDADAFFASVEQAADRRLRGRPVAVGGSRRGVVCSASYEARAHGVHGAMPTRKALQCCPDLVVVRGHFELYERFSDRMFDLCEDLTPEVERMSIDEGYLDLRGRTETADRAVTLLRQFDREVHEGMKITVSCGLSARKRVAQIAGKAHKPHGFAVVPPGNEAAYLEYLPLRLLPGIGPAAEGRLQAIGLRRIGDLVRGGADLLYPILGARTGAMLELARGEDEEPVLREAPPPQSFGGQTTFSEECGCEDTVRREVQRLLRAQLVRLRKARQRARGLEVGIRYSDYEKASASMNLGEPENLDAVFLPQLRVLLGKAWRRRVRLNQIHVRLTRLYPDWEQGMLFDETRARAREVCAALDAINARFGEGTLRAASLLGPP